MPEVSSTDACESNQSKTLRKYLRIIRDATDADSEELQSLHHEVSDKLAFRSSLPNTHSNPNLREATYSELLQILTGALDKVMDILSHARASYQEMRYANS